MASKNRRYSAKQVAEIVEMEGLGYAVEDFLDHEAIADVNLRELWKTARDAMRAIRELLPDPESDEDDD